MNWSTLPDTEDSPEADGITVFQANSLYHGPVCGKSYITLLPAAERFRCYSSYSGIVLVAALDPKVEYILTGNGKSQLPEHTIRMVYSPAHIIHHVMLPAGRTRFVQIVVQQEWLQKAALYNPPLQYFLDHIAAGKEGGIQQMEVVMNGEMKRQIQHISDAAGPGYSYDSYLADARNLFQLYIGSLIELQKQYGIGGDDVIVFKGIDQFLRDNIKRPVSLLDLELALGKSENTIRKAYKGVVGQLPFEYNREQSAIYLSNLVAGKAGHLSRLVAGTAYHPDYVGDVFKDRHGVTVTQLKRMTDYPLFTVE